MTEWFADARFGMFVHWGHASTRGWELSWPLTGGLGALPAAGDVPAAEYHANATTFRPEPGSPAEWCSLARDAGMTYAVLTARHHDGFALWPSAVGDWNVGTVGASDIVGEFVDAARSNGLRVGLYYSLSDWHHPDYPPFTDDMRPYQFIGYPRPAAEAWDRFLDYQHAQMTELLTGYGPIDLLWFDGGWERTAAEWRSTEFETLIRQAQPDVVINDRLPGVAGYETPEQFLPPRPPDGPWETCMTMNDSWGYNPDDARYKSSTSLVHLLAEVAGRGGNLLLNVSPRGDGSLPPEQVERLRAMAEWMDGHGAAIHGTTPALEPWQFHGATTRTDDRIYLHALARPYESVIVRGLPVRRISAVSHLASGAALKWRARTPVLDAILGTADPEGEIEIVVPPDRIDDHATVIALDLRS